MTPINNADWADASKGISTLREEVKATVYRPCRPAEPIEKTLNMELKIGGFIGIGRKPCTAQVTFDRDQYCPGEQVRVKLSCDNSRCKKDVEAFKIKLRWRIAGYASWGTSTPTVTQDFIVYEKFADPCKKGQKFEDTLTTMIPRSVGGIALLPSSVTGKLISVSYELIFFIKHDAWNEFGQGH